MIDTLISIATMLGLTSLIDHYDAVKASGSNVKASEIDLLLKQAKLKGEVNYQKALDKLSAVPQLVTASPFLQDELRKARKQAFEDSVKQRENASREQAIVESVQDRLYNFNAKPDSYKNSEAGVAELNAIEKSVKTGKHQSPVITDAVSKIQSRMPINQGGKF